MDIDPRASAANISLMLATILNLGQRGEKLLNAKILELYAAFGILAGGKCFPTLFHLYDAVAADKRANPQARQSLLDSLAPILMDIGDVLCYSYGWEISELARRAITFQFDGISEPSKDLLYNTLVQGVFSYQIARGVSNPDKMSLYIVADEAARLVSSADSSISDLISVIRGTGTGLELSLQDSQVSRSVISNTPHKFLGRVASYSDLETIGVSMGLTREQKQWIFKNLVPGMFVGQLGQGNWRQPFVFRVPNMNIFRAQHGHHGDLGETFLSLPED